MHEIFGGPLEASISVRDRINKGEIAWTYYGVHVWSFHSTCALSGTEAFRWGVTGEVDARAKVKQLAKAGVNVIKLIDRDQMTLAEVTAVVDEAPKNKLKVVAIRTGRKKSVGLKNRRALL